jgi:hypothetical protein
MIFFVMFSVGFMLPTMEPHLLESGIKEENIGYCMGLYSLGYTSCSILQMFQSRFQKSHIMFFGNVLMSLAYYLLGPTPILHYENYKIIIIGLHTLGWAAAFLYGNS